MKPSLKRLLLTPNEKCHRNPIARNFRRREEMESEYQFSKLVSALKVSQPTFCMNFSSLPCVLHASPIPPIFLD
jgi:hypothetical protein